MTAEHRSMRARWRAALLAVSLLLTTGTASLALIGVGPLVAGRPLADAAVQSVNRPETDGGAGPRAPVVTVLPPSEELEDQSTTGSLAVPSRSGEGRRVVFDMSDQRVWLVRPHGRTLSTYLVSGSVTDNLGPGHYAVYSRSVNATSFNYKSTMKYMVRFTQGENAAIGFHDIPVDRRGRLIQTRDDLGTPQSHGCIRQLRADAKAMWDFAQDGTAVVVVA